jgi:putative DNA primase/helicase
VTDDVVFGSGQEDFQQAEWLAHQMGGQWRYDHTAGCWHHWDGRRWARDDTAAVLHEVASLAARSLDPKDMSVPPPDTDGERKAMTKLLGIPVQKRALEALATFPGYGTNGDDWDSDPHLLGVDNGIVDLRTNTLIQNPEPTMLVTKSALVPFRAIHAAMEAEKRAPTFMRVMREWMSGDEDMVWFLLFWFGASLFGMSPEQRFLLMTGIGRNGKGALKHAVLGACGEYAEELDPALYMRTKHGGARSNEARADLVKLKGLRVSFFSEPSGGAFNEELLKAHTGGDRISARALYSNNIQSWDPTHSISFLTNDLPSVEDVGPSMGERVMVADFRESYEGDRQDRSLYKKLSRETEGILAILVWAASIWFQRFDSEVGGLVLPGRVVEQSKAFIERNDPISNWMNERCERGRDEHSQSQLAYESYMSWHTTSGAPGEAMSSVKWALAMQKKGFTKERTKFGIRWTGFRLLGAMALADRGIGDDEEEAP